MTHTVLVQFSGDIGREVITTGTMDETVRDIAAGIWRMPLAVVAEGRDVTREVFREAVALMRDRGYTRAELPDYLSEVC